MPSTYTLISSNVLSSSAASVTFSAIPSTYTDLVLRYSVRTTAATEWSAPYINFNGVTTGTLYSGTELYGSGSTASSFRDANINPGVQSYYVNGATTTANTFTSVELYIPNYTAAQNKPMFFTSGAENNSATSNWVQATASLFRSTAAITSINFTIGSAFDTGSSFYLYGIKNS